MITVLGNNEKDLTLQNTTAWCTVTLGAERRASAPGRPCQRRACPAGSASLARPSRRGFLLSRPSLAAARLVSSLLVLVAAPLVLAGPALAAEDVTIWSATLNAKQITSSYVGCQGTSDVSCSGLLSDDDLNINGVTYTALIFYLRMLADESNELTLRLTPRLETADVEDLTLHAGTTTLAFADASIVGAAFEWSTDMSWSAGDTVQLRITSPGISATLESPETIERPNGGLWHSFDLKLSTPIWIPYKEMRDHAFEVTNGTMVKAKRINKVREYRNGQRRTLSDHWRMTVEPTDTDEDVTVALATRDCDEQGALCSAGGGKLLDPPSLTLEAPATPLHVSIADATGDEDDGKIDFTLSLSRATDDIVEVDLETTTEGTATEGVDFRKIANGLRVFFPGDTSLTVSVWLIDDALDDDGETVIVQLTEARLVSTGDRTQFGNVKGPATISDDKATGTISNADAVPRALVARFGRAAAAHVVEHVEERLAAPREPGFEGRFAGRELRRGMERDAALDLLSQLGGSPPGAHAPGAGSHGPTSGWPMAGAAPLGTLGLAAGGPPPGSAAGTTGGAAGPMRGVAGPAGGPLGRGLLSLGLGGDGLLTGSAFSMSRETRQGGILSFWSRGAQSSFYGREGDLALDGAVRTTMFGADYARGPLIVGLSLANSRGLGGYDGVSAGRAASSVTGLYPWLGYKLTERVSVWGVTGYGAGGLLLTPEGGPALESGLSMKMAAVGTRGELVAGGARGFGLAFKADALWVGTATEGVDGPAGRMAATGAVVSRVRTALEGSRGYTFGRGLSLKPSVEVGLRHDAGDAEQGSGMDVGGGLVVSDAVTGLAVDVRVRMLLVHEAEGFRERGVSVSLSYNPTPQTPLGLTARVAPSWGGQAQSGAQALWGRETMAGMAHGGVAPGNRVDADLGYGLPVGSRLVGTPRVGFATSEYGRDYRVGYSLGVLGNEGLTFQLGVDAQRRESPLLGGTDNGVLGRATVGW